MSLDHVLGAQPTGAGIRPIEHIHSSADRAKRVAELVSEHGEKVIFRSVPRFCFGSRRLRLGARGLFTCKRCGEFLLVNSEEVRGLVKSMDDLIDFRYVRVTGW